MYSPEIRPIQAETIEEHEKELDKQLINIQLIFADEKFKKIKDKKENLKFLNVLKKYTSIYNLIYCFYAEYYHYQQQSMSGNNLEEKDANKEFKQAIEEIFQKIEAIYQAGQNDWQKEITNLIIDSRERLKTPKAVVHENNKRQKAGIFDYEPIECNKEKLNEFSFSDLSEFVQIHFPDLYKRRELSANPNEIRRSLEELAIIIIDRFPQIEGVVGKSWLMDSALAERLGFQILEKKERLNETSTWGQLKDKNGQINKAVLEKILKTNELPYKVALGIIKIEDFLRLYLPQDRRGKIILKRLKPEADEQYTDVKRFAHEFKSKFDDLAEDQIEPCLRQNQILSDWLDTTDGALFLGLLKEGKRAKMNMQEFFKNKKTETKSINKALEKFIKSKMYEDKEIEI